MIKRIFSTIILQLLILMIAQSQDDLNVMTFNIRLNTAADGENAWPFRKDKVTGTIDFFEIQLLGVQEALPDQVADLQSLLPGYRYTGVGRDDGKQKGEFSAIFFDTSRLTLQKGATFWLSETPAVPGSKGWDAAITRIVTWGAFRDKKTGNDFYVFNTHFDHMGKIARKESAQLLKRKVAEIAGTSPTIIMGDFNAGPEDEPIRLLVDNTDPLHFTDTKKTSASPHFGPEGSFNGFGNKETNNYPIDHIFIRNGIRVLKHATLSPSWEGRFASDHFAIFARVSVQ